MEGYKPHIELLALGYKAIPPAGLAAIDPLTGWNILDPTSPFAMPFARRGTTLCYHSQANVSVTMSFLNWAKGSVLNIDLAATAEWLRLRDNIQMPWATSHYSGTPEEFEAYLLLKNEICPFHISSHYHLRARGYSLGLLRSILASSRFHDKCNKAADDLGLYEADLKVHWERLLYVIIHAVSQQAIRAIEEVRNRCPGEDRCSPEFMDKVQWLITDRRGLPITPFVHHPFQLVLATRGPPEIATRVAGAPVLVDRHAEKFVDDCPGERATIASGHHNYLHPSRQGHHQDHPPRRNTPAQNTSQSPASSRASSKRPHSDGEEPPSGFERRYPPRLAARSRAGTASMSPLVNELGGTEDMGAPDALIGPMEVDDGNGEDDALFDPIEIDDNKDENGRGRGRGRKSR
ncbi:hypothetical protein VSDG_03267 [Cytospora chrysosperma]|uniref:Uncharacterized protein n=1 Tax=Cytospora chrysosperma TaxID=252740 RepID=A0A423WBG5_CYTCH|nr:hypothetical protein VSDG_03267 [Valsa sordida]